MLRNVEPSISPDSLSCSADKISPTSPLLQRTIRGRATRDTGERRRAHGGSCGPYLSSQPLRHVAHGLLPWSPRGADARWRVQRHRMSEATTPRVYMLWC